jgi:hypothetical protein
MPRFATRSSIQFCTSWDSHATLQAPSRIREGNRPAASSRAICAKLYGTPKTLLNSFFETSFCVIGHSLRKGSTRMLARNQLAGDEEHSGKCLHAQRAHSCTYVTRDLQNAFECFGRLSGQRRAVMAAYLHPFWRNAPHAFSKLSSQTLLQGQILEPCATA